MRVAVIAEHYPPTDGGVATSAARIAGGLAREGAMVQLLTFDYSRPLTDDDYVLDSIGVDGVNISRVGPFFLKHPFLRDNTLSEKTRAILRRRAFNQIVSRLNGQVDIILSLYVLQAGFIAQLVANEIGVPCVAGVRGNDIGLNIFHTERFAVTQWVIAQAQRIVCVNDHLKSRLLVAFPDARAKTQTIANGVAVQKTDDRNQRAAALAKIRSLTRWTSTDTIVVFIGRLREKKGVVCLLEALSRLDPELGIRLLVVGPSLGMMERKLCGQLWDDLERSGTLYCTGNVPREEVPGLAIAASVVVMPSLDDGLANGLLEGMALGLCPLVSDIFSDVISNGVNGRVVRRGNSTELSDALRALHDDAALVARLGKAAASHALSDYSPIAEARKYMALLEAVSRRPRVDHFRSGEFGSFAVHGPAA